MDHDPAAGPVTLASQECSCVDKMGACASACVQPKYNIRGVRWTGRRVAPTLSKPLQIINWSLKALLAQLPIQSVGDLNPARCVTLGPARIWVATESAGVFKLKEDTMPRGVPGSGDQRATLGGG